MKFQTCGDSLVCGNWFFHMTGFYTVALSAVYGISVYCLSEYSDAAFLDIIIDNKPYTAALYPWQVGERRIYINLKRFLFSSSLLSTVI